MVFTRFFMKTTLVALLATGWFVAGCGDDSTGNDTDAEVQSDADLNTDAEVQSDADLNTDAEVLDTLSAPTLTPAPGLYFADQAVTLACAEGADEIWYTTDGSTPSTTNGTLYSASVAITETTTIRAMGTKSGWLDSLVTDGAYEIKAATPIMTPAGGNYSGTQTVTITTTTPAAEIRFTTDGSTPDSTTGTVYSGPVSVDQSLTLRAIAYKAGLTDSDVADEDYVITLPNYLYVGGTYMGTGANLGFFSGLGFPDTVGVDTTYVYVVKVDATTGIPVWGVYGGVPGDDNSGSLADIDVDGNGDIVVSGRYSVNTSGAFEGFLVSLPAAGSRFVMKLSGIDGSVMWSSTTDLSIGGTCLDPAGDVYVVGSYFPSQSAKTGYASVLPSNVSGAGTGSYVIKLPSTGGSTPLWFEQAYGNTGGTSYSQSARSCRANANAVYVAGYNGTTTQLVDPTDGNFLMDVGVTTKHGASELYLVRLDPTTGTPQWGAIGHGGNFMTRIELALSGAGDPYVQIGYGGLPAGADNILTGALQGPSGSYASAVVRLSATDGSAVWLQSSTLPLTDVYGNTQGPLWIDSTGNAIVTGDYRDGQTGFIVDAGLPANPGVKTSFIVGLAAADGTPDWGVAGPATEGQIRGISGVGASVYVAGGYSNVPATGFLVNASLPTPTGSDIWACEMTDSGSGMAISQGYSAGASGWDSVYVIAVQAP